MEYRVRSVSFGGCLDRSATTSVFHVSVDETFGAFVLRRKQNALVFFVHYHWILLEDTFAALVVRPQ